MGRQCQELSIGKDTQSYSWYHTTLLYKFNASKTIKIVRNLGISVKRKIKIVYTTKSSNIDHQIEIPTTLKCKTIKSGIIRILEHQLEIKVSVCLFRFERKRRGTKEIQNHFVMSIAYKF